MKSAIFLAVTGAVVALASPLDKRVLETKVVVEYYTVTVTGNPPAATPTNIKARPHTKPTQQHPPVEQPAPKPTTIAQPAPEPTTIAQPVVVVTVTTQQQPQPQATTVVKDPVPEASTVSVPTDDTFQSQALYHHNIHRANHSSPELVWNDKIAGYATITANTCHFAHDMYVRGFLLLILVHANSCIGQKVMETMVRTLLCGA
jgi:outer membrane biosynthesis protein TonB